MEENLDDGEEKVLKCTSGAVHTWTTFEQVSENPERGMQVGTTKIKQECGNAQVMVQVGDENLHEGTKKYANAYMEM